jgi:hypothetical protein
MTLADVRYLAALKRPPMPLAFLKARIVDPEWARRAATLYARRSEAQQSKR